MNPTPLLGGLLLLLALVAVPAQANPTVTLPNQPICDKVMGALFPPESYQCAPNIRIDVGGADGVGGTCGGDVDFDCSFAVTPTTTWFCVTWTPTSWNCI